MINKISAKRCYVFFTVAIFSLIPVDFSRTFLHQSIVVIAVLSHLRSGFKINIIPIFINKIFIFFTIAHPLKFSQPIGLSFHIKHPATLAAITFTHKFSHGTGAGKSDGIWSEMGRDLTSSPRGMGAGTLPVTWVLKMPCPMGKSADISGEFVKFWWTSVAAVPLVPGYPGEGNTHDKCIKKKTTNELQYPSPMSIFQDKYRNKHVAIIIHLPVTQCGTVVHWLEHWTHDHKVDS